MEETSPDFEIIGKDDVGTSDYHLTVIQYDESTRHEPVTSNVKIQLNDNRLYLPISLVLSEYCNPVGGKYLTTPSNEKIELDDPVYKLFHPGQKEATIFIHFGENGNEDEMKSIDKEVWIKSMSRFEEALKIPGFCESEQGKKVLMLLRGLEKEYEKEDWDEEEIRLKTYMLDRILSDAIREHRWSATKIILTAASLLALVGLVLIHFTS